MNDFKKFDNNRGNENYENTELGRTLSRNSKYGIAICAILTGGFTIYKGIRDFLSKNKS